MSDVPIETPSDLAALVDLLDAQRDELAHRVCEILIRQIPDVSQWDEDRRDALFEQAKNRFGALLAIVESGAEVDIALQQDMQGVGANAARMGSSLPHLLSGFRLSRDVLLQSATRALFKDGSIQSQRVLQSFSQRLLPVIDRLTDSIAKGFWGEKIERISESVHRFETLVARLPYGVYEVDIDGLIRFANPAMAILCGRTGQNFNGYPLNEVLKPIEGKPFTLLDEPDDDVAQTSISVLDADGYPETLDVDVVVRRVDGVVVGFVGLVRQAAPVGLTVDLAPLVRHIHELRRSVEILQDAGDFINRNSSLMTDDQVHEAGQSVSRQAQRLMVIIDELDADRRSMKPR